VNLIPTAHQVNLVVVLIKHVPYIVLVPLMTTAHQVNLVAIVIKVLLVNVLDLVLENHVKRIPTVDLVNIVVLMENVP
jgi:hypothetical protein